MEFTLDEQQKALQKLQKNLLKMNYQVKQEK